MGEEQHADPHFLPESQYWVPAASVEGTFAERRGFPLVLRNIARTTDVRSVIGSIAPKYGYGNSLPMLVTNDSLTTACLAANLERRVP